MKAFFKFTLFLLFFFIASNQIMTVFIPFSNMPTTKTVQTLKSPQGQSSSTTTSFFQKIFNFQFFKDKKEKINA